MERKIKHIFVEKDNKVYCSGCGSYVLNDSYQMKQHMERCKNKCEFIYDKSVFAYNERTAFIALFYNKGENLIFEVVQPEFRKMSPVSKNYVDFGMNTIFKATFKRNSKIVEEEGLYNIDIWFKKMLDEKIVPVTTTDSESLLTIMKTFSSVMGLKTYGMLLDVYRNRGLYYDNTPIEELRKLTTDKETEVLTYKEKKYIKIHTMLKLDKTRNHIVCMHNDVKVDIFLGKNYCKIYDYSNGFYDYKEHCKSLETISVERKDIEEFIKYYPELMLDKYYDSGATNIIIPLAFSNFDKRIELLYKADCGQMCSYIEYIPCINIHENTLNKMYGVTPKLLKKLSKTAKENLYYYGADIFWKNLIELSRDYNDAFLNIEEFTAPVAAFITNIKDINRQIDISNWSRHDIHRLIKYLGTLKYDFLYTYYQDYIRMCELMHLEKYNKFPKDLKDAHDYMMELYQYKKNEIIYSNFIEFANSEEYSSLGITDDSDDNEEKYTIIVPDNPVLLIQESEALGHCVKTYIERVSRRDTMILFLRKKNQKEKPFATIEVTKDKKLIQLKAKSNNRAPQDAQDFVKEWAKEKGIKIDSYDFY